MDTFAVAGVTYTDRRESNAFSISIASADVVPDIKDPANLKVVLGTQSTGITDWKPTVHEKGTAKNYAFAGTLYTPSHDLGQYGLSFDKATGKISGTPHTPFIIRDFTISVTSQRGDTDVTKPFWIGVAPSGDIAATSGQPNTFTVHAGAAFKSDPLKWDNVIGNLTHTRTGSSQITVATADGTLSSNTSSNWGASTRSSTVTVTDEFGRKGQIVVTLVTVQPIAVTTESVSIDYGSQGSFTSAAVNLLGTASFSYDGLPLTATVDSNTGLVSIPANTEDGIYEFTVTVTDSQDKATGSASGTLRIAKPYDGAAYRHWKVDFVAASSTHAEVTEIEMFDANGVNVAMLPGVVLGSSGAQFSSSLRYGKIEGVVDGIQTVTGLYYGVKVYDKTNRRAYMTLTFPEPEAIHRVDLWSHNTLANYRTSNAIVYASQDGQKWKEIYRSSATSFTAHEQMP